eukprot:RCo014647
MGCACSLATRGSEREGRPPCVFWDLGCGCTLFLTLCGCRLCSIRCLPNESDDEEEMPPQQPMPGTTMAMGMPMPPCQPNPAGVPSLQVQLPTLIRGSDGVPSAGPASFLVPNYGMSVQAPGGGSVVGYDPKCAPQMMPSA